GPVRTERWTGLVHAMARDMNLSYEQADKLAPSSIPLGRIAESDEVADLVTFLASDRAFFVNGTMIEIDGGQEKPLMDKLRDRKCRGVCLRGEGQRMGVLVNGRWTQGWHNTSATAGRFVRQETVFRNWITPDGAPGPTGKGGFRAEPGRYHLYVSLACPWAHRTL